MTQNPQDVVWGYVHI